MTGPKLFTSHWRSPLLADADATMIGISRGVPRWHPGFRYRVARPLAPDDATWAHEDLGAFEESYRAQLERLGAERILADLGSIAGDRPAILLCWERDPTDPETPCHRRYLAEFLEREAGVVVPELAPGDVLQREGVPEPRLF